ncbi:hypothetical protein Q8A67_024885 [Cirrhinus molitorella]|uniref:Uncharacterized protein n=1 Tax=Cirrhinus molitorella TaxID=172907 RepID=A0AA88P4G9_9TELE|nr:hypothetical protein Q8A67_024885 [Cirrhinus molitorella]
METLQSEARPGDHSHPIPQSLVSLINTLNERNSYKSPDAIASEEARSALNNSQCNTELYMSDSAEGKWMLPRPTEPAVNQTLTFQGNSSLRAWGSN